MERRSTFIYLAILLFVIGAWGERPVSAQDAAPPALPKELSALKFKFEVSLAEIQKPKKALKGNYEKRLNAISAELQRSGDLEGVLAVKAELEALKEDSSAPSDQPRNDEPRDLEKARAIYQRENKKVTKSISQKSEPVISAYQSRLEKLKVDYTREGNLTDALSADKLIKQIPVIGGVAAEEQKFSPIGKWDYFIGNDSTPRGVRTFRKREMIDARGGEHPWELNGEGIRIPWNQDGFEQLVIDPANPDVLTGVNQSGQRLRYVRKGSLEPER